MSRIWHELYVTCTIQPTHSVPDLFELGRMLAGLLNPTLNRVTDNLVSRWIKRPLDFVSERLARSTPVEDWEVSV